MLEQMLAMFGVDEKDLDKFKEVIEEMRTAKQQLNRIEAKLDALKHGEKTVPSLTEED